MSPASNIPDAVRLAAYVYRVKKNLGRWRSDIILGVGFIDNRYDGIGTRHKGALLKTNSTKFYSEDGLNEVNRHLSHCPNFDRQPSRMQDFYRRIPKIVLIENSK